MMSAKMHRFKALRTAPAMFTVGAMLAIIGCSTSGNQAKNSFGYGYQITPVSNMIYRIDVKAGMGDKPDDIRKVALTQACGLTQSKGYSRFQIVGGDGFRTVSKNVQAGPVPLPLLRVPEGSIVIKMLEQGTASDSDTVDVAGGCPDTPAQNDPKS
jgi:hypothetical protein